MNAFDRRVANYLLRGSGTTVIPDSKEYSTYVPLLNTLSVQL